MAEITHSAIVTTDKGIRVRDIQRVMSTGSSAGYSYIFDADDTGKGDWVRYGPFCCADWSAEHRPGKSGLGRTVKVGHWDVKKLWETYPEARIKIEERFISVPGVGKVTESAAREQAAELAEHIAIKLRAGDFVSPKDVIMFTGLVSIITVEPVLKGSNPLTDTFSPVATESSSS